MDKACLFSVILFFLSNFVNLVRFTQTRVYLRSEDFSFKKTVDLDPGQIHSNLMFRFLSTNLASWANLLNAFAWFSLIVPVVKAAWVLSKKGKRVPAMHGYMVLLVFGGSYAEFTSRLMETGLEDYTRYIVINFNLKDWGTSSDGDIDGMGWRVLEVITTFFRGFMLWIDSLEWVILFQIMLIIYVSVRTEEKGQKSFSPSWGFLGLLIGIICVFDFVASVLRMNNWRPWSFTSIVITFVNRLIFIPIWLILLGRQLPKALLKVGFREDEEEKNDANGADVAPIEENPAVPATDHQIS